MTRSPPALTLAEAATALGADIARAIAETGRATLIWSGGRTPASLVPGLAGLELDWARVTFLMGDERWVPLEDANSNEGQMRRYLAGTPLAAAAIAGLYREALSREAALPGLEREIADLLAAPACAALLGMGPDGHTASLFRGGAWLELAEGRMVTPGEGPADGVPERMSLTPAALARSQSVYLLCNSPQKQALWARARQADPSELPIAILTRPGAPRPVLVS
jgi:6-phosphogluconolactonase